MPELRNYSSLDRCLMGFDAALHTLFATQMANRPNPADCIDLQSTDKKNQIAASLTTAQMRQSAACMRVNHSGEICAQALYQGQSLLARQQDIKAFLQQAAREETDHLAWCEQRLQELHSHTSYLNIIWYTGALLIGLLAGLLDDRWSLGFIKATEDQVEAHLQTHLDYLLPTQDLRSRVIVRQMQIDESQHGGCAMQHGGEELPLLIQNFMRTTAKVMTVLAYYI